MRRRLTAALAALGFALLPGPALAEEHEPRSCVPGDPAGYERVVELTFPVSGDTAYRDDYHDARNGGRRHQGTDVMAAKLQRVHAVLAGVVEVATGIDAPMPSYGFYLRIRHDDGTSAAYVHLNNDTPGTDDGAGGPQWAYAPGIRTGVRVERGQWIGYVGDSGNAESTASHLHFELSDPQLDDPCLDDDGYRDKARLNPYPSLVDAARRGDLPAPPPVAAVTRIAGSSRVLTSVAIARHWEPDTRAVIVVPEGSHAEALVAAPLAGLLDAPVLLAGTSGLHDEVVAEVRRLQARNAYVLGRLDQLPATVEERLREAGVTALARIAEPDVFALSARVARELRSYPEAPPLERAFVALGQHPDPSRSWPDALSAGALAALTKSPVLLVPPDALPEAVRTVLTELQPPLLQIVGGPGAISAELAAEAAQAAGARAQRLSGENRFATSVAVAQEAVRLGLSAPLVWVATGHAYPDALAAGPAAARQGAPLVLVDGRRAGGAPEPESWLADRAAELDEGVVVGGTAAISDAVKTRLAELLGG